MNEQITSKQEHSSFINRDYTIAANGSLDIPCYCRSIEILNSSTTTPVQISLDGSSPQNLQAGVELEFDKPFTLIQIYNQVAAQITITVAASLGKIKDQRVTFGTTLPVNLTSNAIQSDVIVTALIDHYHIDNAAAVDKGGGLVGIPVTGHPFTTSDTVTLSGTTNYNASYAIVSQTANEIVITATYVAENFAGTETITPATRSIAALSTQREIIIVNLGSYTVYVGDANVSSATYRGTPITAGSDITLCCNAKLYVMATTAACNLAINRLLYS